MVVVSLAGSPMLENEPIAVAPSAAASIRKVLCDRCLRRFLQSCPAARTDWNAPTDLPQQDPRTARRHAPQRATFGCRSCNQTRIASGAPSGKPAASSAISTRAANRYESPANACGGSMYGARRRLLPELHLPADPGARPAHGKPENALSHP